MASVPDSNGASCDDQKSCADQDGETSSAAQTVGGSLPEGNESVSSPKDSEPNDEEEDPDMPDFYTDWFFEMKDMEKTKFRRGILEWRYGELGKWTKSEEDEVVDLGNWLLPETFHVKMLRKKRTKVKVILKISLDAVGIEVDPDLDTGGVSLPKGFDIPLSVDALEIVACEVVKRKSRDRTMFRIINYAEDEDGSGGYKKNYFESETLTAEKIIEKLHGMFEVKASSFREDYLEVVHNERKSGMRRIFSFGCG